jgi:adenine/guanine/hypoxanthine permease
MSQAPTSITTEPDVRRPPRSRLDHYFRVSERGSSYQREVRGGLATFFTMAYIVVLNPLIIGTAADVNGATLGVTRVAGVTALVAGVMTLAMGLYGRYPYALAAGLGLNSFVAVTLVQTMTWPQAMGLIVLDGLLVTLLVLTGFRRAVITAIPDQLKTAISVGIGLFLALIGFVDAGFVRRVPDVAGTTVPLQLGAEGRIVGWPAVVFVLGVLLIAVLAAVHVRGAILIGIVASTVLALLIELIGDIGPSFTPPNTVNPTGWSLVVPALPDQVFDIPDLSLLGAVDLTGAFRRAGLIVAVLFLFTLMLSDFFDSVGSILGVAREGGMLDEHGELPGVQRVLLVDSLGAAAGGLASASSNTTYVESAAGVGEGARTGLASVVTGGLFLLAMFFTPLVKVVPFEAATPALVIVGFLMMAQVRSIDFTDFTVAIPAFLTIVVMPYTYSITNGIGAGFLSYTIIKVVTGRGHHVHPLLWIVSGFFLVYFAIEPLEQLLGV